MEGLSDQGWSKWELLLKITQKMIDGIGIEMILNNTVVMVDLLDHGGVQTLCVEIVKTEMIDNGSA